MIGRNYLLIIPTLLIAWGCASPAGNLRAPSTVLKQYQFSGLDSLMAIEQRPVAVFLHTEWCRFCKNMEQTTFQNKQVVELLNERYYFVSFDGEQKESVTFRSHRFQYQPSGRNTGTHELAIALGTINGSLAYPAFVILNPDYEIVFQHNAFLTAKELANILEAGYKK